MTAYLLGRFALDQIKGSVAKAEVKLDLRGLPTVPNAAFDSHVDFDEPDSTCLLGTRIDILQKIRDWITQATDKSVFWLNGMAGTGKSTIARSVAQEFAQRDQLGASFFFKRGDGDRQSCKYLFTTIAFQLAQFLPALRQDITTAIDHSPDIGHKTLKEQFDRLILSPFKANVSRLSIPFLLVIDALDECVDQDKVQMIISLLSELGSSGSQYVRIFLTSRREQVFREIATDTLEDIILHEITETTIEQDISRYLDYKFDEIKARKKHELSASWPGQEVLKSLTAMSSPLFIFAATICRFIGDRRSDPVRRLQAVLDKKQTSLDKLQQTYQPILEALLEISTDEEDDILQDFRNIVGSIVVLIEPLTALALSKLLKVEYSKISTLLHQLHSVLRMSNDSNTPIRTLHASFGDYLLNPHIKHSFWIDGREIHCQIALRCLDILQFSDYLSKGDICGLKKPGFARKDVDIPTINEKLPAEIRYACCYWVYHLREGFCSISMVEYQICGFLKKRFLVWFEALSLFEGAHEATYMLSDLSTMYADSTNSDLKATIYDASRFVIANSYIADVAPLQLYLSCIIFSPQHSTVRANSPLLAWLKRTPTVTDKWDALLRNLEGQTDRVDSLTYSPDGKLLASSTCNHTIKLWDASSGQLQQTLEYSDDLMSVAFSANSKLLGLGLHNGDIQLWCVALGQLQQSILGHQKPIASMAFSPDGKLFASSARDRRIKLWDITSGELQLRRTLTGPSLVVDSVAFSPTNSDLLLSSSQDSIIQLWNLVSGEVRQPINLSGQAVSPVSFSPDGNLLAFSTTKHLVLQDVASNKARHFNVGHSGFVWVVVFSPDGKLLASGDSDGKIKLWDVTSGQPLLRRTLSTVSDVHLIAFRSDNKTIASNSLKDYTIQLWNIDSKEELQHLSTKHSPRANELIFSPDGKLLASVLENMSIKLYAITLEQIQLQQTFKAQRTSKAKGPDSAPPAAFSPNGKLLAYGSGRGPIKIWSLLAKQPCQSIFKYQRYLISVAFSPNSKLLIGGLDYPSFSGGGGELDLWDVDSSRLLRTLQITKVPNLVACSSDGKLLAYCEWFDFIELCDTDSGRWKRLDLTKMPGLVNKLSFHDELPLLETNLGSIDYRDGAARDTHPTKYDIQKDWILGYGQRLLWLPPEHRGGVLAHHDDLIALGLPSGQIVLLEISLEELGLDKNAEERDEDMEMMNRTRWTVSKVSGRSQY